MIRTAPSAASTQALGVAPLECRELDDHLVGLDRERARIEDQTIDQVGRTVDLVGQPTTGDEDRDVSIGVFDELDQPIDVAAGQQLGVVDDVAGGRIAAPQQ